MARAPTCSTALGERGEDVSARIVGAGDAIGARVDDLRRVIDGKGADLLAALGERGAEAPARIAAAATRSERGSMIYAK